MREELEEQYGNGPGPRPPTPTCSVIQAVPHTSAAPMKLAERFCAECEEWWNSMEERWARGLLWLDNHSVELDDWKLRKVDVMGLETKRTEVFQEEIEKILSGRRSSLDDRTQERLRSYQDSLLNLWLNKRRALKKEFGRKGDDKDKGGGSEGGGPSDSKGKGKSTSHTHHKASSSGRA